MKDGSPTYATSADGTRIAYETVGSGPPVVIVSGAFGTRTDARELAGALSGRVTAAGYDRRGRGDSGDSGDTQPYSPARELDDLRAVIDALGGSAFVYGHSSGGALSLDAVAAGLPIAKLAVYEPPFTVDDSRPPYSDGFVETLRGMVEAGRRGDAVAEFWRTGLLMPEPEIETARQAPFWPQFESLAHTLIYDYEVLGDRISGRPLPSAWADSIAIPILIFEGGDSPATLRNVVTSLEAILPNATKRTLAGQGHGAPADVLAPILEAFYGG
jgi:alpha-beta hydrolase superfamily lysophospholipase